MRATGLQQGDPSGEIIELLDEHDAVPDRAHGSGGDTDGHWRRWLTPMSGLAVLGVIAYAIASSSSTHSPASTTASTVVTNTTAARRLQSSGTPVVAGIRYYAADAPGYTLRGANVASGTGTDDDRTSYQRWTAVNDSSAPESWFSIETYPAGGPDPANTINAYRVDLYGRSIAISYPAYNAVAADFAGSPTLDVHLLGMGLSDGQVLRLVGAVDTQGGNVILNDASAYAGYERATTVSPWFAIARTPIVQADYGNRADGQGFSLTVGRIDPGFDGGVQLSDRSAALRHNLVHTASFTVDGHVAVAGEQVDDQRTTVATWMVGFDVITLTGSMPVAELMSIARTVHEVTVTDWQQMIRDAAQNVSLASSSRPTMEEGSFAPIAFGRYGNGETWEIEAAPASLGSQRYITWLLPNISTSILAADVPQLTDELRDGHTYMLAALPRTYSTAATLHIDRPGLKPVAVPLQDPGPEFDRTLAAYAFTEPGMFTAWIEAEDGSILAEWP